MSVVAGQPLAIVRSQDGYDGLLRAFRQRAEQIDISRETINEYSGLTYGHKTLMPPPAKVKPGEPRQQFRGIGRKTLAPMLRTLAVELWIVQNDTEMAALQAYLKENYVAKRKPGYAHANTKMLTQRRRKQPHLVFKNRPDVARLMRARGVLKLTRQQRTEIAQNAAHARWKKRQPEAPPKRRPKRRGK